IYLYMERLRLKFTAMFHRKPVSLETASRLGVLAVFLFVLNGCAAGPNYKKPISEIPPQYKEQAGNWKAAQPQEEISRGKWWELFGDPQLNALEERVNVSNQTLKQSEAQYREAVAFVRENRAGYWPTITTNPAITTSHAAENRQVTVTGSGG